MDGKEDQNDFGDDCNMTEDELQQMLEYRQQLLEQMEQQQALQAQLEQLQMLRAQMEEAGLQQSEGTSDEDLSNSDVSDDESAVLESKADRK